MDHHKPARREFLMGLAGFTAAIGSRPIPGGAQSIGASTTPTFMYVGSFTGEGRGHGEGLSVFRRDRGSSTWTLIQVLKELADPSFVIIDRRGRRLYSAHGDGDQATAYRIDEATGRLAVLNRQPTGGSNGVHLAIDATDRFLAVANYATGSLAVLPINEDGSLAPVSDLAVLAGTRGPHRTQQESSHPHQCPFDRTGRFIVVPDKGLDKMFVYRLDTGRGRLVPADPPDVTARAGAAPRHVGFHPSRPYAYVINELDSTVTAYHFDPEKGVLKPFQILTTLPSSYTGNNTGAEIAVAPSGRFLYGSNRGHDSIAIFAVDASTGVLTSIGWEPTQGRTPRFFGLDPTGTRLYAANQTSDTVVIFEIDQTTGKLAPANETVKVATPSTIVFR
jgi:6-phosphogluconolactonase (cycloisomerase 2 family)